MQEVVLPRNKFSDPVPSYRITLKWDQLKVYSCRVLKDFRGPSETLDEPIEDFVRVIRYRNHFEWVGSNDLRICCTMRDGVRGQLDLHRWSRPNTLNKSVCRRLEVCVGRMRLE